jgi:hypothetical protein
MKEKQKEVNEKEEKERNRLEVGTRRWRFHFWGVGSEWRI